MGGLSKKVFQIKSLAQKSKGEHLLLDSGNLLFKQKAVAKEENQERLTASAIIDIYQHCNYDAVAVGPHDLAGGLTFLEESKKNGFPWISANLVDKEGKLLFDESITKTVQGKTIVITALSNSLKSKIPGIEAKPWEETLPPLLQKIKDYNPDSFVILLSSLNNDENYKIASRFDTISLIITADSRLGNVAPKIIKNSLITQTMRQGKVQGVLEVTFGKTRQWGTDSKERLAYLQNKLGSINWQLKRLNKKRQKTEHPEKYDVTLNRLTGEKENLDTQITEMKNRLKQEKIDGTTKDLFTYQFVSLKKNMANDAETAKRIDVLNGAIRALHKKKTAKNRNNRQDNTIKLPQALLGANTCSTCHELQGDFWKNTRHALAYDTLEKKKKNFNLDCLPCHMTVDIPGGKFDSLIAETLLSFPETLRSVGCENCHGSGKKHIQDPEHFKLVRSPGRNICLTCHTDEHDDNFDYKSDIEIIACPAG